MVGRWIGKLSLREASIAALAGGYGNIGYMGPGLALAVLGTKAAVPTALIFCFDSIFLFSVVPILMALTGGDKRPLLATVGLVLRAILFHPLIVAAYCGALAAALHLQLPAAVDNTLQFLQNAAAPVALFVLGVTVALRPFGRVPWEIPAVISIKLRAASLDRVRADDAVRAVHAGMGRDRGADGVAAAGAECIRDRPAVRHLGRAGLGRGADRHLRLGGDADQRDVDACAPA